jgi:hypothetical protein
LISNNKATGYLSCEESGNVYLISITDGLGLVELGMEYGNATVVFPGYGTKKFVFGSPFVGELDIDIPSTANLNQKVPITVYGSGQQKSAKITMISPDKVELYRTTSETEPIQVEFGQSGNWTLIAELYGAVTTKKIYINPIPLEIKLPNSIKSGKEFQINVNTRAKVTIEMDAATWNYESDDTGLVYFIPPWAGRYKITAKTANQEGIKYFSAQSETQILIKDEFGSNIDKLSKDDIVLVQVVDSKGQQVSASDVVVVADGTPITTLNLVGGSTIWRVSKDAMQFIFDYSSNDNALLSSSLMVTGSINYYQPETIDNTAVYIILVIIAIIIILIILHKKQIIDLKRFIPQRGSALIEEDELF